MNIKLLKFSIILFLLPFFVKGQPINVSNIVTTGRFNTCGITPTITATLLSNTGSTVQNGALACLNPNDTSIINITIDNLRWNQNPDRNWLHGIFFPSNAGIISIDYSLFPSSWVYVANLGCTGSCTTGGQMIGGRGLYFVGTSGGPCCVNGGITPSPCDNWGDNSLSCSNPFSFSVNIKILNSKIFNNLILKFRGSSDGNTGCWSIADLLNNSLTFQIQTIACANIPFLCNPIGSTTISTGLSGPYQWQRSIDSIQFNNIVDNSNYSGANNASLSLNNISTSSYGEQFRCIANGITGQIFTLTFKNTWTGAINSDWATPGNWSCGTVPDGNTDAFINFGNVVVNTNNTVRSLAVTNPGTITVNSGAVLTVLH